MLFLKAKFLLVVLYLLFGFTASQLKGPDASTTKKPGTEDDQCSSNDTREEASLQFTYGEGLVDQSSSLALLGQLLDGPVTRKGVHEIATRLAEISRPRTSTSIIPRCRFGEAVDQAAHNLLAWMTQDQEQSSQVSSLTTVEDDNSSDDDYCDIYNFDSSRRKISVDTMKRIVKMADEGKSEKTIRAQYKWYRPKYLYSMRSCLEKSTPKEMMKTINEHVVDRVREARLNGEPVHDHILKQWAIQKAAEVEGSFRYFRASDTWVKKFKKQYGIVSRAVTRYTSRNRDQAAIDRAIAEFLNQYRRLEWYFARRLIWNVDQVGFNYEITNKRTLSWKGERDTVINVGSKNKLTHSYSAQPMISRDGSTIGKLRLVLQERKGVFPRTRVPYIRELGERYRNIRVVASSSGNVDNNLMQRWVTEILLPAMRKAMTDDDGSTIIASDLEADVARTVDDNVAGEGYEIDEEDRECFDNVSYQESCWDPPFVSVCKRHAGTVANERCRNKPNILLLHDSFSGFKNAQFRDRLRGEKIKPLLIPQGTTDELQPLDVNFNRQYKKFVKRITEQSIREQTLDSVTKREGIINMHSLIWNQFSSPSYQDMIRHAWHNTDPDYVIDELATSPPGQMVDDVQFSFNASERCEMNCTNHAFIRCSHCGKLLCLKHFLERSCFHNHSLTMDMDDHLENHTESDDTAAETDDPDGRDELRKETLV